MAHYEVVRFCSSFRRMPESRDFAFVFFFCIPANEWGIKNRAVAILLGSGFRHSPE